MAQLPIFKYNIFTEPVKLLVKESHAIFSSIPRSNLDMPKSDVINISRRYRSILHECVENLAKESIRHDLKGQIKTFQDIEVIWNLCEILLIDVNQTGTLILQLKNWIKMHFDHPTKESKEILEALDENKYTLRENDTDESFWNLVLKLVLVGDHKKACQLMQCHYHHDRSNQSQLVSSMLERMPLSNQYIVREFCNKWSTWSEWCKREKETGQFDKHPALLKIVRLLCGDTDVYTELAQNCETWHQLMVARLLYTDPCIKDTDLTELCRQSINIFKTNNPTASNGSPNPDSFDEIIISTFEYDLIQVIAHCCSHFDDNWWFVTHFVDLLHCSNQLKIHEIVESDKLRETFLQDYASTLFDDENLWPIGVSYLDKCPKAGVYHLEALLTRIPISVEDELTAHKIISISNKRGLTSLSNSVCLLMARKWLSKTHRLDESSIKTTKKRKNIDAQLSPAVNLSNALYWAVKSGDIPITTYISDQYLYHYCIADRFPDIEIFESLRNSPLNNDRLAFLTEYHEFKQIVEESEDDLGEAGSRFRDLLASKVYPVFFRPKLINDAKFLLDCERQLIFRSEQTIDLMRSVEEIAKGGDFVDIDLRKSLVRNMGRALVTPTGADK